MVAAADTTGGGSGARSDADAPSQTLSRGIRILEVLAEAERPLRIDDLAAALGVHRSIAYRLVRTLEHHGLVTRDDAGTVGLGSRLAALGGAVARDLQAEALPELTAAANDLGMTCFLAVLDRDECVTLVSIEPRHAVASVAQHPGTRHPVTLGAPGKAVLGMLGAAERPPLPLGLAAEVEEARRRGWATSHDEVIANLHAVAVPLALPRRAPAAIAVVYVSSEHPDAALAERLTRAAAAIASALGA